MTVPAASPPLDEMTTALLDLFRQSKRTVYDGAFGGDPAAPGYPYAVLYSVPGGSADPMPDLDADYSTVTAVWQVTAVSGLRNQAQQTARVFRDLLLARAPDRPDQLYGNTARWRYDLPAPRGWQVVDRRPDLALAGVIRTGDTPTAIFSAPFKFALTITPT